GYFEIDSNKRSVAIDVVRHPALEQSNGSLFARRRSKEYGIREGDTSRARTSRRITARFRRENRGLGEDQDERSLCVGVAETMRSDVCTMGCKNEGARISRYPQ